MRHLKQEMHGSVIVFRFILLLRELGMCQSYLGLKLQNLRLLGKKARGNKGYKKVLSEFDKIIGLEKIRAIHLNDSKTD
jgi:hypothetical protein